MILRESEFTANTHKEITEFGGWRAYLKTLGREN